MEKMSRTDTFAKLFFLVSCTGLLTYVVLAFYTFHTAYTAISQVQKFRDHIQYLPSTELTFSDDRFTNDLKYILFWTVAGPPNSLFEAGQRVFINYNCSYINCYITSNKYLLNGDYRNFEAIVFNASNFKTWDDESLPQRRAGRQKYVFYSTEPADSGPTCNICAQNYFNWTWTYKLDSDIFAPLIKVCDERNVIVAPDENVNWITDTSNLRRRNYGMGKLLTLKKKTVACIIDKCETKNETFEYATKLQEILKTKSLVFDIYGCTSLKCLDEDCTREINNKYSFYLAYEESFAVDYVSREVLKAYDAGAVPIIVGGADYHKFLPGGSYISARNLTLVELADMIELICNNSSTYDSYHNWREHYVIRATRPLHGVCDLCSNLNDERKFKTNTAHETFRSWWYSGSKYEKCKIDPDPSAFTQPVLNESDLVSYYTELQPKLLRLRKMKFNS